MTTIIRVKYVECSSENGDIRYSEATSTEREMLINVNCPIRMVLDYIRKVARINGEFDLCDDINCQLKNVSLYESCTPAMDILPSDSTYFIITFERDENGQMTNLTPLLTAKTGRKCYDILAKTRKPSRKTSSSKTALRKNNSVQQL